MAVVEISQHVDARGLSCPMPIVKTAQAIKTVASGELIEVLATDPGSVKDFAAWSARPATSSSSSPRTAASTASSCAGSEEHSHDHAHLDDPSRRSIRSPRRSPSPSTAEPRPSPPPSRAASGQGDS